jgi:hypothetical protein
MRGWGRPPIYKASRPEKRLGIQATRNLAKEGKKERCGGQRKTCEETREERLRSGSRKN